MSPEKYGVMATVEVFGGISGARQVVLLTRSFKPKVGGLEFDLLHELGKRQKNAINITEAHVMLENLI